MATDVWENLVVQAGRRAGRVHRSGKSMSDKDIDAGGVYVSVPSMTFDRLVREGRLNHDGTVPAHKPGS